MTKSLLLWMWLAQSGDALTTCHALRSGQFMEGNMLMPASCKNIVLTKVATMTALSALALKYPDSKGLKVGLGITAGMGSFAVSWNIYQTSR